MKTYSIIFLAVLSVLVEISLGELVKVPIKSHKLLTPDMTTNEIGSLYDKDMGTVGSFYFSGSKYVQLDFDLGTNYVIEKIEATVKSDSPDINFIVGNLIDKEGGLLYNCSKKPNSVNVYECIPQCRSGDSSRNGIIARKLLMSFLVNNKWASIYEVEVFTKSKPISSEYISESRLVTPSECNAQSWLLTRSKLGKSKPIAHNAGAKIFLEKPYVITELEVSFQGNAPETMKIQLSNGEKKQVPVEIDMGKCTSLKSKYTCQMQKITFPTRVVTIVSSEVSQLFLRGKPVFYPTIDVAVSDDKNSDLMLTCKINNCDLSVHSDCSKSTIESGVQFQCMNKRLIRLPGGSELNSFVIVNQGQVEKIWSSSKFSVDLTRDKKMIVTMPRSYQYFGQYQCSCLVTDESNTDITSKPTTLQETDFLENLVFKTDVLYKVDESETSKYNPTIDNLIILQESELKNTYIVNKIQSYSLINGIGVTVSVPITGTDSENVVTEISTPHKIKAFVDNPQSWSVNVYRHDSDDMYPEFDNNRELRIKYTSKKYLLSQEIVIPFIKISEKMDKKSEMLKTITDKSISIKVVYTGSDETKLVSSEQSCLETNNKVLAVFTKNKCVVKEPKFVKCTNEKNFSLLSFVMERNLATKYDFSIMETQNNSTVNNITVASNVTLNEKDVQTIVRYTDIAISSSNPNSATIEVELEFISKIVNDFIPCGKVLLKVMESSKPPRESVLQKSKITLAFDVKTENISVPIRLEIEGIKGFYSTIIQIINPATFAAEDIEIKDDGKLYLLWSGIKLVARNLLVEYEIKSAVTVMACQETKVQTTTVKKSESAGAKYRYQSELSPLSKKHSSKLVVSIQPVFKGRSLGKIQSVEKEMKFKRSTKLIIDDAIMPRQKTITVVPSQSDISCPITKVDFQLNSTNVENVIKSIVATNEKNKYTINDLVPGRKYILTARVNYQNGPADEISKEYNFETTDDISISQTKHVAQVNGLVNITCTADLGPMDKFRKVMEWRRADNSPLPEGVNSITKTDNSGVAFLVMMKAMADYSGDYGCFVKPEASMGKAKITVIINDLIVTPNFILADFGASVKPITITCYSSSVGDTDLIWTDSNDIEVPKTENENFKIEHIITEEKAVKSILTIKLPSLKTSGTYKCHKSIGESKATQTFLLYGQEKLNITKLANSSSYVGETSRFRCNGQAAMNNQKVEWEPKQLIEDNVQMIKTSYPDKSDLTISEIEIMNHVNLHQITCKLIPAVEENKEPLSQSVPIKLFQKIKLHGPTYVTAGDNANLTCYGHHTKSSEILQLFFHGGKSANTSSVGVLVASSDKQTDSKPYQPIQLVLKLTNVKETEAGRYECRFKSDGARNAAVPSSWSVDIKLKDNLSPLINCPDCPKQSAQRIFFNANLSKSICLLVVSFLLFFSI